MRKALIFATIVAAPLAFAQQASAQYCYDLVGTTVCTEDPNAELAAREQEYMEWVDEQSQITPVLPEVGSEVIPVVPGPLLEGTNSTIENVIVEVHEPLSIVDIGTSPTPVQPVINSPAVAYEPAVRIPVWTCDVIAIF